jgi:hypothetical protein
LNVACDSVGGKLSVTGNPEHCTGRDVEVEADINQGRIFRDRRTRNLERTFTDEGQAGH